MSTAITTLKSYFTKKKKPTEQQFAELIDAFIHRDEDFSNFIGQFASIAEAQSGVATDKYMSPFLTKTAINELTRLANISQLESEVSTRDDSLRDDLRGGILQTLDNLKKVFDSLEASKENTFVKKSAFNKAFGSLNGDVLEASEIMWRAEIDSFNSSDPINRQKGVLTPTVSINTTEKEITIEHNINSNVGTGFIKEYHPIVSGVVVNHLNNRYLCDVWVAQKNIDNMILKYIIMDTATLSHVGLNSQVIIDVVLLSGGVFSSSTGSTN